VDAVRRVAFLLMEDDVKVELLYFEGCPNWTVAEDRPGDALRRGHAGSPTVEHFVEALS
jgi:hypothetical protein